MSTHRQPNLLPRAFAALCFTAAANALAAPAFTPDSQPIGYVAQPRATTLDVRKGDAIAFYTDYEKTTWSGNLIPYSVTPTGRVNLDSDIWPGGAASLINNQHWQTGRKIVTLKDDGTRIPFLSSDLSGAQKKLLGDKAADTYIMYLRGYRGDEGTSGAKLRVRRYVLGDIIRSRPAYVGGAVPMVYVGANDGMLHAIHATTGEEVYAYIPTQLIPKLMNLAPLATATYNHKHFVDASPRAATVKISGVDKRILVGGLGAGGRGLWALDITDDATAAPATEAAAANRILWEITPDKIFTPGGSTKVTSTAAYANLGHTYGEPIVGLANNGEHVVFMANGYMNTLKDPAVPTISNAGNGKAVLYAINPANGALVRAIDTGSGSTGSPNGLSSPTPVDVNGDGKIDYLYAGDLDGNLWRFNVTDPNPANWTVSLLYTTSPAQAITGAPAVSDHPKGGRMVNFGTGRTLTDGDMSDAAVHYMYGIWDGAPVGATTLLTQTFNAEETYFDVTAGQLRRVRTLSVNAPDWTTHRGWKVALPAGERVVGDRITLTNGRVYVHSFNPTTNQSGKTASPPLPINENWEYQFNYLTGGGATKPILDLNKDGKFDDTDLLPDASGKPINERAPAGMFLAPGVLSQPVVVTSTIGSRDLYTQTPDLAAPIVDPGVSGGHFDVDIYYPTSCTAAGVCTGFSSKKHHHEYDDKYNVTGVNMLNASDSALNLSKSSISIKHTSPQTQYKVLVVNQYLNPAAMLKIGADAPAAGENVKVYRGQASATDAAALLASLPVYTPSTVNHQIFNLPLDAFKSKDWWGNGDVRAGLIPTQTGCVNKSGKDAMSDSKPYARLGPQGEIYNGSLTVMLIRADTPASALELNVAGKPEYGWRVKASLFTTYVRTVWTWFWHHPNGMCYGDSGWLKDPPEDTAGGTPGTAPPGTEDPKDGTFSPGGSSCSGSLVSTTTTYDTVALTKTETLTYSGGCTVVRVYTRDGYGLVHIETTINKTDGTSTTTEMWVMDSDEAERVSNVRVPAREGRISWRELIRE